VPFTVEQGTSFFQLQEVAFQPGLREYGESDVSDRNQLSA
jgi:hypothetical protein